MCTSEGLRLLLNVIFLYLSWLHESLLHTPHLQIMDVHRFITPTFESCALGIHHLRLNLALLLPCTLMKNRTGLLGRESQHTQSIKQCLAEPGFCAGADSPLSGMLTLQKSLANAARGGRAPSFPKSSHWCPVQGTLGSL